MPGRRELLSKVSASGVGSGSGSTSRAINVGAISTITAGRWDSTIVKYYPSSTFVNVHISSALDSTSSTNDDNTLKGSEPSYDWSYSVRYINHTSRKTKQIQALLSLQREK